MPLDLVKNRDHMFKGTDFRKSDLPKDLLCVPYVIAEIPRRMRVGPDRDNPAAEIPVQPQDIPGRLRIGKPVVPGGSVDLDSFSVLYCGPKDLGNDVSHPAERKYAVLVIADDEVEVGKYAVVLELLHYLQDFLIVG